MKLLLPLLLAVNIVIVPGREGVDLRGILRVNSACPSGDACKDVVVPLDGAEVSVDCPLVCSVSAEIEGWWAAPVTLSGDTHAEIRAWPKRAIRFTLSEALDAKPRVAVTKIAGRPIDAVLACTSEDRTWMCVGAAAPLDLRVQFEGFAPRYFFDVDHSDLGTLKLVRGASLSGHVAVGGEGRTAIEGTRIDLTPSGGTAPTAMKPLIVTTDGRGFFQYTGVAPGAYSIAARKPGWSDARLGGILITPDAKEYALQRTLVLMPLSPLEVVVTPQVTKNGGPWRIRVERRSPQSHLLTRVGEEEVPLSGFWVRDAMEQGSYRLSLLDEQGSVRARSDVVVKSDRARVQLDVAYVPIEGHLTAAGEPLEGTLIFSARNGAKTRITADEKGRFSESLPHAGIWNVTVQPRRSPLQLLRLEPVEIARSDAGLPARVDLELPGGWVEGVVTDTAQKPVRASVTAVRGMKHEGSCATDDKGHFSLFGLAEGAIQLEAVAMDERVGSVSWDVSAENNRTAHIVVLPREKMSGRVVMQTGEPFAGAVVRYTGTTSIGRTYETTSGLDGSFVLELPKGSTAITAAVFAPGYPIRIVALPVGRDEVKIAIGGQAGSLRVSLLGAPPWPWIRGAAGLPIGLRFLRKPEASFAGFPDLDNGAFVFALEPGPYTICRDLVPSDACITRLVQAGQEVSIDTSEFWTDEQRRKAQR